MKIFFIKINEKHTKNNANPTENDDEQIYLQHLKLNLK